MAHSLCLSITRARVVGSTVACSTKAIGDCFWEKDALRKGVLVKVHGLCRKGMCMDLAIDAHEGSHPRRQCLGVVPVTVASIKYKSDARGSRQGSGSGW